MMDEPTVGSLKLAPRNAAVCSTSELVLIEGALPSGTVGVLSGVQTPTDDWHSARRRHRW